MGNLTGRSYDRVEALVAWSMMPRTHNTRWYEKRDNDKYMI